jgi:hypothetical protein
MPIIALFIPESWHWAAGEGATRWTFALMYHDATLENREAGGVEVKILPSRKPKEVVVQEAVAAMRQTGDNLRLLRQVGEQDLDAQPTVRRDDDDALETWVSRVIDGLQKGTVAPKTVQSIAKAVTRATDHVFEADDDGKRVIAIRTFNELARDRKVEAATVPHLRTMRAADRQDPYNRNPFAVVYGGLAARVIEQNDFDIMENGEAVDVGGLRGIRDDIHDEWFRLSHRGKDPDEYRKYRQGRLERNVQKRAAHLEKVANKANEKQADAMKKAWEKANRQEREIAKKTAGQIAKADKDTAKSLEQEEKAFRKEYDLFANNDEYRESLIADFDRNKGRPVEMWEKYVTGTMTAQEYQMVMNEMAPKPSRRLRHKWENDRRKAAGIEAQPMAPVLPHAVDARSPRSAAQRARSGGGPRHMPGQHGQPQPQPAPSMRHSTAPKWMVEPEGENFHLNDGAQFRAFLDKSGDRMIDRKASGQSDIRARFIELSKQRAVSDAELIQFGNVALGHAADGYGVPDNVHAVGGDATFRNMMGLAVVEAVVRDRARVLEADGAQLPAREQKLLDAITDRQARSIAQIAPAIEARAGATLEPAGQHL